MAASAKLVYGGERRLHAVHYPDPRRDGQAPSRECRDHLLVSREAVAPDAAGVVDDHVERTPRHDLGVEELQRPGARVARVHESLAAGLLQRGVEAGEAVARHVHLAANLYLVRRVVGERLRNRADRPHVLRHVVADLPVAARRGADQAAVFVEERHRHPVHLRLDDVPPLRARRHLAREERVELHEVALLVALVERLHRRRVAHLRKAGYRLAAHPERRRVGVLELGVLPLKGEELLVHRVVFGVGDDGARLDVVQPVVAVYLRNEMRHSLPDVAHSPFFAYLRPISSPRSSARPMSLPP